MTLHATLSLIGRQPSDEINLVEAGLVLAQWFEPNLHTQPYLRHVQTLVQGTEDYVQSDGDDVDVIVEALRQILVKRYGYGTALQDDDVCDGTNLARVIDLRRGASISLCILYAHILEQLGQRVDIVDFPARPLVRLCGSVEHIIIDPCDGGKRITAANLRQLFNDEADISPFALNTFDKRAVLLHLLDVRKLFLLRHNAPEAAIATLQGAVLIAPNEARLWRELGVLHSRLDHIDDSISALQQFLQLPGAEQHRYSASQLLQKLTTRKDPQP